MRGTSVTALALLLSLAIAPSVRADALDDAVNSELKRQTIPGLAVGIEQDGKITRLSGYGSANLEWQVPVTPDTLFQTGSTGKQFASLAILMLQQEGKLSIEDPISKYFPDVPASWADIKLKHLLSHTSGLEDDYAKVDLQKTLQWDEVRKLVYQMPKTRPAGAKWAYCNAAYIMLGMVIEKLTGAPYHQYFTSHIFKPLGMNATRDISEADIIPGRASGYEREGSKLGAPLKNQAWVSTTFNHTADGSTYISARDLTTYIAAMDVPNPPFAPLWTKAKAPVIKADPDKPAYYGMGWFTVAVDGTPIEYHSGAWQGFRAFIIHYPKQKTGLVVLVNSDIPEPRPLFDKIMAAALPGLPVPPN
ncbi:serine hydrolase domain-containing protein [Novosphingobium sp.]|uniref:serine hydrolase domain-containing protein n=1 Tax=Novosphingobium sp. TaxID=1874826 RepID=UPI001DF63255|nr:serine hydrolase domain-containing protein [Novosphingobium sp.]MBX9663083.1 beta-lactamase family protein [Novosphingobium sp.]